MAFLRQAQDRQTSLFAKTECIMSVVMLSKKAYYKGTFTGLTLANETIVGIEFEECEFQKCSFVNCNLDSWKFLDCKIVECRMSAINPVRSRFQGVKFLTSQVIGFDWTRAEAIEDLEFTNCKINYSNFKLLKLPRLKLINCEAHEVDFINTDLTEGVFTNTDFENSRFFKADLTEADFRGAKNYTIDARNTVLKKTKFSLPEALALLDGLDIVLE